MTKTDRYINIAGVIVPFLGFLAAIVLLWNKAVGWTDLGLLVAFYLVSGLGITIGFHRLLTHRAFMAKPWLTNTFAVMGSFAIEGPVITWVADHRKHHAHTDEEGDPHSPHVGHGSGLVGLYHSHMGWMWKNHGRATASKYAPDLLEDRGLRMISNLFPVFAVLSLALPFALGWLIGGTLFAGFTAFLWGGLARLFLLHHVTWSINSVCHFHGLRRFDTDDHSRNVPWLAAISMGEAWHHNHHAFPRSAFAGLRWWEFDPSGLVIRGLRRAGLIWNVVEITPERQQERLAGSGTAARLQPSATAAETAA